MLPRVAYLIWQMRREQWYSPETLERIQQERLKKMVHHAYRNTRFYRDLFKRCGVTPQDIKTKEDLKMLEVTKKSDLQDNIKDMVASGYSRENCRVSYTTGSTGAPALILYDKYTSDYYTAQGILEYLETGYYPWEKIAYTKRTPWKSYFFQNLGLIRAYHIDSTRPEEEQADLLNKVKPSLVVSYPTLLYCIARTVLSKGLTICPRAAIIGGEILAPHVREYIEKVFSTRIYEAYATIEFATIARECPHGNWHINTTQNAVEFEDGKILVTGLINKAVPLIRYEIGDVGSPKEVDCPCGRGSPVMQIIEGRKGDIFVLPDGREVPPPKVAGVRVILDTNLAAKRYQMIQEDLDYFIIRVVPTNRFTKEIEKRIKEELIKDVGYPITVDVECVDEIPLIDDRKLRVNICRVKK